MFSDSSRALPSLQEFPSHPSRVFSAFLECSRALENVLGSSQVSSALSGVFTDPHKCSQPLRRVLVPLRSVLSSSQLSSSSPPLGLSSASKANSQVLRRMFSASSGGGVLRPSVFSAPYAVCPAPPTPRMKITAGYFLGERGAILCDFTGELEDECLELMPCPPHPCSSFLRVLGTSLAELSVWSGLSLSSDPA